MASARRFTTGTKPAPLRCSQPPNQLRSLRPISPPRSNASRDLSSKAASVSLSFDTRFSRPIILLRPEPDLGTESRHGKENHLLLRYREDNGYLSYGQLFSNLIALLTNRHSPTLDNSRDIILGQPQTDLDYQKKLLFSDPTGHSMSISKNEFNLKHIAQYIFIDQGELGNSLWVEIRQVKYLLRLIPTNMEDAEAH
eukprot:Gb_02407 [translate_table: standard]